VVSFRKRTKQAIVIEILEATLSAKKKMRIMYKANLNYDRFNRYFSDLTNKGFIDVVDGRDGKPAYRISERGRTLLATLQKAEDLFSSDAA
jgi:predicted transcriptional regulator